MIVLKPFANPFNKINFNTRGAHAPLRPLWLRVLSTRTLNNPACPSSPRLRRDRPGAAHTACPPKLGTSEGWTTARPRVALRPIDRPNGENSYQRTSVAAQLQKITTVKFMARCTLVKRPLWSGFDNLFLIKTEARRKPVKAESQRALARQAKRYAFLSALSPSSSSESSPVRGVGSRGVAPVRGFVKGARIRPLNHRVSRGVKPLGLIFLLTFLGVPVVSESDPSEYSAKF